MHRPDRCARGHSQPRALRVEWKRGRRHKRDGRFNGQVAFVLVPSQQSSWPVALAGQMLPRRITPRVSRSSINAASIGFSCGGFRQLGRSFWRKFFCRGRQAPSSYPALLALVAAAFAPTFFSCSVPAMSLPRHTASLGCIHQ